MTDPTVTDPRIADPADRLRRLGPDCNACGGELLPAPDGVIGVLRCTKCSREVPRWPGDMAAVSGTERQR